MYRPISVYNKNFRCGMKDKEFGEFVIHDSGGWTKKDLTYRIDDYPSNLNWRDVEREIARAFNMWAEVTPLTFQQTGSSKADIVIRYQVI